MAVARLLEAGAKVDMLYSTGLFSSAYGGRRSLIALNESCFGRLVLIPIWFTTI